MVVGDFGDDYRCLWRRRPDSHIRPSSASGHDRSRGSSSHDRSGSSAYNCPCGASSYGGSSPNPLGHHSRPRRQAAGTGHPDAGSDRGPGCH